MLPDAMQAKGLSTQVLEYLFIITYLKDKDRKYQADAFSFILHYNGIYNVSQLLTYQNYCNSNLSEFLTYWNFQCIGISHILGLSKVFQF